MLQRTATHCNTLQYASLLHVAPPHRIFPLLVASLNMAMAATRYNTLQHAATHCNTLQHTATSYNTLQHTATYCNTLQHTATHDTCALYMTLCVLPCTLHSAVPRASLLLAMCCCSVLLCVAVCCSVFVAAQYLVHASLPRSNSCRLFSAK